MNGIVDILIPCIQPHLSLLINDIKMRFQKFESDSYCVGGRRRSSTKNIHGDIPSKGSKVRIGYC